MIQIHRNHTPSTTDIINSFAASSRKLELLLLKLLRTVFNKLLIHILCSNQIYETRAKLCQIVFVPSQSKFLATLGLWNGFKVRVVYVKFYNIFEKWGEKETEPKTISGSRIFLREKLNKEFKTS